MKLIAIDDGHGRETAGKRTPIFADGAVMLENEFNEAVAEYLEQELKAYGFNALRVSPETTDTPLETRVKRANSANADCYISIHANAFGTDWNEASGIETWVFSGAKNGGDTYRLAEALQSRLIQNTARKNRGVKTSGALYVLNATKMPAALLECGFMTNREEAFLLRQDSYRRSCAKAICQGLCDYFGIQMNRSQTVNNQEDCPMWKQEGEAYLREAEFTQSVHNPLEIVDFGTLGSILSRVMHSGRL